VNVFVDSVDRNGRALGEAARQAGLEAAVPTCPGWSVFDLVAHQGRIHRWVTGIVEARGAEPADHWSQWPEPAREGVFDWYDDGHAGLVAALERAGDDGPAWTRDSTRRAGRWARRQAHENEVHRYDAQSAVGAVAPIDAALAVDGIQEVFDIALEWFPDPGRIRGDGETLHLHCTDVDGEWLVRLDPDGAKVTHEHAKGDVAVRGTASDLFLMLWGRIPPSSDVFQVFGDAAVIDRWRELTGF
jgi:uncharacterized protein (TIGR03083 family)